MPRSVVVGIGEVLWDVFPHGEHFGGAPANVAMHAAALGAKSYMVGAVGPDARGDAALARLDAAGVNRTAVAQLLGRPTGVVNVSVGAKGQPSFDIAADVAWDYLPWSEAVDDAAGRADAFCFGTLAQRAAVSRATIKRALKATRKSAWRLFDVDRKSTRLNSSHVSISYAVFCLKKKIICIGLVSAISSMTWIGPRVTMSMGEDHWLLRLLGRKNGQGVPTNAIVFQLLIVNLFLL